MHFWNAPKASLASQVRSATVAERAKTSPQSNRLRIRLRRKAGNTWSSGIGSRLLGLAYRFPRACSVWLLLRSFYGHIQIHNRRKLWMTGVSSGPAWGIDATGHPGPDIRAHARMKGTQKLLSTLPSASLVDSLLFLEGWDMGAEWAFCNPDYGKRLLDSKTLSTSDTRDSTPQQLSPMG
jgi:hypothetical protein